MDVVIRKQNQPDSIKWVSKEALGTDTRATVSSQVQEIHKHITNSPDLQALPLFQVLMNTNFFSKTLTLLPRNKLLPHTYCHRNEQQSSSAARFQSPYKHEGNFIYNFENAKSVLLLVLHYSG